MDGGFSAMYSVPPEQRWDEAFKFCVTEQRINLNNLRDWDRLIIRAIQRGHQSHLFSLVGDVVSSSDGGS